MEKKTRNNKQSFQHFVSKLENKILTGGFKPRERLVEANVSQMFGVSRYWVRDAFKVLETKELVNATPFKGFVVSELSEQEVEEIFVIRVALEQLALRLAMHNITPSDIKTLRRMVLKIEDAHKDNDVLAMVEADGNFHDYVFQLSRNQTLRRMINDMRKRCHIIRYSAWSSSEVVNEILAEHRKLVDAIEAGDTVEGGKLAETHIGHAKKFYVFQLCTNNALQE
jgi:DNA-binding GntR family transcriptional regulator